MWFCGVPLCNAAVHCAVCDAVVYYWPQSLGNLNQRLWPEIGDDADHDFESDPDPDVARSDLLFSGKRLLVV